MSSNSYGQADTRLSYELAFIGGYSDAASFVLTKTFTGHVTGNLVLVAVALTTHDWRIMCGRLSAIATFLLGTVLSLLIVRSLALWPASRLLPSIMAIGAILTATASLALASSMGHGVEIFVVFVSLALGLQNGAFCRAAGISLHTTYLTGTITSLISSETEGYVSDVAWSSLNAASQKIGLLRGIGVAFVLGAGAGAAMVLHFRALRMLGAALLLGALVLQEVRS